MTHAGYIDIVLDGPPEAESGRFVEVEDASGASIAFGTWVDRGDGTWALRIQRTVGDEIMDERATHETRGWDAAHDDSHRLPHLLHVAREYTVAPVIDGKPVKLSTAERRERIVKAASVLVAAIDFIDRQAAAPQGSAS